MDDAVFWICAAVSVPAALLVVLRRNPVYSALALLVCFLSFAVLFLTLGAPFLAAIHVLVYTGAILVLFLFVIMLLNLKDTELGEEATAPRKALAALFCAATAGCVGWLVARDGGGDFPPLRSSLFGGVREVGRELFTAYLPHFELIGLLLLVAMIGAVILAKKKI